jgi:hypothetical protein
LSYNVYLIVLLTEDSPYLMLDEHGFQ